MGTITSFLPNRCILTYLYSINKKKLETVCVFWDNKKKVLLLAEFYPVGTTAVSFISTMKYLVVY